MFDIAYSYIVDQIFLIDALLSYDLNKIRSNPDRYSWVIDTQNLDMYNDACLDMQMFYRKYLGRDYV